MIVALTGFMGCGKSSVGRELKELLSCPFIDLDEWIEAQTQRSVSDIFRKEGEAAFRTLEREALARIFAENGEKAAGGRPELVLSLGGGTLTEKESARLVKAHCRRFYLRAGAGELTDNLRDNAGSRPVLAGSDLRTRVEELLAARRSLYEDAADEIVDVDGLGYGEIARKIRRLLDAAPADRTGQGVRRCRPAPGCR